MKCISFNAIARAFKLAFAGATLIALGGCLEPDGSDEGADVGAGEAADEDVGSAANALSANLLTNGDFSAGGTAWTAHFTAPATGAITYGTGTAKFGVNTAGTQSYQAQLYQNVSVVGGKTYSYSFAARKVNVGTRNIDFVVETNAAPYTKDVTRSVSIDGNWTTFTGTFTATSSRVVRIEIQGGLSELDFEVDNFFVGPRDSAPVISAFSVPAQSVSPTVPLTIAATDDVGVTGYHLSSWPSYAPTGPMTPALDDPNWTASKPSSYTSPDPVGCTILALYVKDASDHISEPATTSFCVVDAYETDDTAAAAKTVTVGAAPQKRSSHLPRNWDWAKFSVEAGKIYAIDVVHTTEFAYSYSPDWSALVSLYASTNLTTPLLEQREVSPGGVQPTSITFKAAYTGTYYVRYEGRYHYRINPNEAYTLAVKAQGLPPNLLLNSSFANGGTSWTARFTAPATGAVTFGNGTARFGIDTAGTQNYHAQLFQTVAVTAGRVYGYSFAARKTNAGTRDVTFMVETNAAPYDKDVNRAVTIDGTWKTFSGTFTATSSRVVRVEIQAGLSDLDFEVDDFYLGSDAQAPTITTFTAPTVSQENPTVPLTIAASDDVGIAGYFLMSFGRGVPAGPDRPAPDAPGWTASKPTTFTSPLPVGCLYLALYVKDFSDNISTVASTDFICFMDSFEPDDTSATASGLPLNLSWALPKNSHENLNQDWSQLDVVAGQTYTITVQHTDAWYYTPSVLNVYTSSNTTTPITSVTEVVGLNQPMIAYFVAAYTGTYYVQYVGRAHYRFDANETYTIAAKSP